MDDASQSEDRRVLAITGGSRGIGAAVAESAARAGWDVLIGYRSDSQAAQDLCIRLREAGGIAQIERVDVTDAEALQGFLDRAERMGTLGGVVASAGAVSAVGPLVDLDPEAIRRDLEVNLLGAVLTVRAAIPALTESKGSIVLISSAASTIGSPGAYVHYAAAKAGVDALTVGLSKELAPRGIRVNCVQPGTVWTDFHQDPDRPAKVAPSVPWGRAGYPEEIAPAVLHLLSDDAGYTTGAAIRVAGGM
ncbi:SDR family oxidoreductase [Brachybacterium sp. MASK1Z-5]|uniref:SDR family oxidoreductase n=1 Tax=Brachybacterium halotolerans TaxID=2795215 RepID=A0ABS1BBA6_9MICO|nr:SDR family NAD(P)-dependent oxidoreductase [Brachybacterium halotolerans]MBK0331941.1 SDR family oxidoreductase [Brachybacterium halotolerans]